MFVLYMIWGCKSYSVYDEWEKMKGLYEKGSTFFGVVLMVLFFSISTIMISVCVSALLYKLLLKKLNGSEDIQNKSQDKNIYWKCSSCRKWNSSNERYCVQCECPQTGNVKTKIIKNR